MTAGQFADRVIQVMAGRIFDRAPREVIVPRRILRPADEWDRFAERRPDAWWWHRADWLDYTLLCRPGLRDASAAVIGGRGDVVAILPALVDPDGVVDFAGRPHSVFDFDRLRSDPGLDSYLRGCGVREVVSATRPSASGPAVAGTTRVLDLAGDEGPLSDAVLRRGIRRSYHQLIALAETRYAVTAESGPGSGRLLDDCRRMHLAAAGRETRPAETWVMMGRWADAGLAAVAHARPSGGGAGVGYAYAFTWKGWAYYGSGVTLARDGLGALLQWALIRHLRGAGVRHYELGYLPDAPTEKDRRIQFFKQGFGGRDWHVGRRHERY